MKAVVLAAGEGERMHPLTCTRPKVMLPIANRPILEHLLIEASGAGISEFIFVVGYHDEQVRDYFGNGDRWGLKIDYVTQRRRLGTADAVRRVRALVDSDLFLVMNGDVVANREDIARLADDREIAIGVKEVGDVEGLGVVKARDGYITHIYEKVARPPSHIANTGLYLFTPAIFDAIARTPKSPRGEYEITHSLQLMLDKGHRVACREIGYWLALNYPWELLVANEALLAALEPQNQGEIEDDAVIRGAVSIGEGTTVKAGSYIVGPVIIGRGCDIGPNCYIRPYTSIGDGCRIGAAVEIKGSIIMKGSKIPHHNYIGDSVVGEGCNLGSGTKIANLRLDKKEVSVAGADSRRRKLGAIIGDGVETGINASINVGSVIGNDAVIGPGAVASGVISPGARIF